MKKNTRQQQVKELEAKRNFNKTQGYEKYEVHTTATQIKQQRALLKEELKDNINWD